jgi:broad specificity phosphatase PhoE
MSSALSLLSVVVITTLLSMTLVVDLAAATVGANKPASSEPSESGQTPHEEPNPTDTSSSTTITTNPVAEKLKAWFSRRWEAAKASAKVRFNVYQELLAIRWHGIDEPSLTTSQSTSGSSKTFNQDSPAASAVVGPFPPNRTLTLWYIRHGESFNNILSMHLNGLFAAPYSFPEDPTTPLPRSDAAGASTDDVVDAPKEGKEEKKEGSTESLQFATGAVEVESVVPPSLQEVVEMGNEVDLSGPTAYTNLQKRYLPYLNSLGEMILLITSPVIAPQRMFHLYHLLKTALWVLWEELAALLAISEEDQHLLLTAVYGFPEAESESISFIETEFRHPKTKDTPTAAASGSTTSETNADPLRIHSVRHRSRFINTPLTLLGESQAQQLRDFILAHPEEFPSWFAAPSHPSSAGNAANAEAERVVYVSNLRRAVKTALLALEPVLCVRNGEAEEKSSRERLQWANSTKADRRLLRRSCTSWTPLRIHSDLQEKNSLVVSDQHGSAESPVRDEPSPPLDAASPPAPLGTIHHPCLEFTHHQGNAVGKKNLSARVDSFLNHILETHGVPQREVPETQQDDGRSEPERPRGDGGTGEKNPADGVVVVGHNAWLRVLLRRYAADEELARRGLPNCGVLRMQLQTDQHGRLTLTQFRRIFVPREEGK